MTVVCAVKVETPQGILVSIGADTEVTSGEIRLVDIVNKHKLFRINDFVIAISGGGPVAEAIEDLQEDKIFMKHAKIKNKRDARMIASEVFAGMKSIVESSAADFSDIKPSIGGLLIATPTAIYGVCADLSVFEYSRFYCEGIGASVAFGVLEEKYKALKNKEVTYKDLHDLLKDAIIATSKHILGCNKDYMIEHVKPEPVKQVKTKEKKPKQLRIRK